MIKLVTIFKRLTFIIILAVSFSIQGAESDSAIALFKARKYQQANAALLKVLPQLRGRELSKTTLYLAYSYEKLRKYPEAEKVFKKLADDTATWSRHRTEACLAYANLLKKRGKDPRKVYEQLLNIPGGHPKHRAKALKYLKAHKPALTYDQKPKLSKVYVTSPKFCGLNTASATVLFDSKNGLPVAFWSGNKRNILLNADYKAPLWKLHFMNKNGKQIKIDTLDASAVKFSFGKDKTKPELNITYTVNKEAVAADVIVKVKCSEQSKFLKMSISVQNKSKDLRLWELDFPKLLLRPFGSAENNQVVYPWRRGRVQKMERFAHPTYQEYPGSSARFQFIALSSPESKDSIYFASMDNGGNEKIFRESFNPATKIFNLAVTQFPLNRGLEGNDAKLPYEFKLGCFKGDWFDAARIYRKWWQQQAWASRGPLALNKDVPEWLKKAPVFLRFYLRASRNYGIARNLKGAMAWAKFLEQRPTPATLYHYSQFKEPENRKKYPVAEYYGYCAPPYPGLDDFLTKIKSANIRPNVFLQSEIFNQHHDAKDRDFLRETLRNDVNGKPVLYLNERWIACRQSKRWRKRYLDMTKHLLDMGFDGLYMDTFGKNKINHECFNTKHGHPCGGGNIDNFAQRGMGKEVVKMVKSINKDFYIGGEASVEAFPDILDYKLNATNVYKDMASVERALYGDYILSHGRVVRGKDENNDNKIIAMDFIEGVIPGRYYCSSDKSVPQTKIGKEFLKKVIRYTENAVDYLRTGEMLHSLKFSETVPEVVVVESVRERKIKLPALKNAVYRSWKDKSIGVVIINIADEELENQLTLPKAFEWKVSPKAKIYKMDPDGRKSLISSLDKLKQLKVKLPSGGIAFYIVSNK
jgi:Domain of unknown function (DUF6259)